MPPRSIVPVMLIAAALNPVFTNSLPHFDDDTEPQVLARQIVNSMSSIEVIGQVLMFGYHGEKPDTSILSLITKNGLGGVKIFGNNANNRNRLAETVTAYQKSALKLRFGIPLLIATDQEGGWVRHIRGGSSITPGNMALGADPIPGDALETGRIIGRELAAVGVNMNFAPTVDIFIDPQADVLGPRTFSSHPGWTGILGQAFARGQEEHGVISTAKHFPGHGDTSEDSHGTLPVVYADLETLRRRDFLPYEMMIKSGLPAIMVGHLAFPTITGDHVPATFSEEFLTIILRKEMGFDGIIVTDDLFMDGARMNGDPLHQGSYRAMLAGADLLLVSQDRRAHRDIYSRFQTEMLRDRSFNDRVREAAVRILKMKITWLKGPESVPYFPKPSETEPDEASDSNEFILTQAARSITLVRDKRFPIKREDAGKVLIAGSYPDFFTEGRNRYPNAKTWSLDFNRNTEILQRQGRVLAQAATAFDTVIVLLSSKETAILLNELEGIGDRIVIISVLSPAHLDRLEWARTALAAYGTGKESFQAAFAALAGDFVPEGRLPIPLK